jgi:putative two-component system response regulator
MKTKLIARPCVLVVDDMSTNRMLVKRALSDDYDTLEAENASQVFDVLNSAPVDVILLDIMMPEIDGFEICSHIHKKPEFYLLPIILLTGLTSATDIARGLEAGACDYIKKPFNFTELKARVKAAVERKRLTDRLDDTESVLFSLARMVEARDENTGNHCDRLAHMGVVFGKSLGLSYEQLEALRRGGVLHDIGKLGIPDAILLKKGKLDSAEWETMKQHPNIGAALCAPLRTMRETVNIVRCHHERWDGSGYPLGLAGEDIPLLARVFQIVDIFDALTTERPYKPAFPREKVIGIMKDEADKGFWDATLMKKFISILQNAPESLSLSTSDKKDKSALILDDIFSSGVMDWYKTQKTHAS